MSALGDPDALPASDLGLLRSASLHRERELAQRAESWRPWRAYAVMYLWQETEEIHFNERDQQPSTRRAPTLARRAAIA